MDDINTKILIYAHDGVGLGHVAKLSVLAHMFAHFNPDLLIYFMSGYNKIYHFLDDKIPCIQLPSFNKMTFMSLTNPEKRMNMSQKIRDNILQSVLLKNEFSYIIIDMFYEGSRSELKYIIPQIKSQYPKCKIILTLRGVIFSKESTLRFFKYNQGIEFINTYYHKVVCFCDHRIIDLNKEYFDSQIMIPIDYLGYIYKPYPLTVKSHSGKNIVIDFGGGYLCDDILLKLLNTIYDKLPSSFHLYLILGDYIKDGTIKYISDNYKHLNTLISPSKIDIIKINADLVIGCGGYNVTMDAILNNIPLIVIPKTLDEEAIIHMKRLEQHTTIKVVNNINEIDKLILKTTNSDPFHDLKIFKASDIPLFFN